MTSPPLIVDASLAVRSAMVPYRAEIEEIAAAVVGHPETVGRAGAAYQAGATASATTVSNLQEVSDGIARYWSGRASQSYQKANAALGQRVIVAQRRLDRQSQVMARVAQAQAATLDTIGQVRTRFDAAEQELATRGQVVAPGAVTSLVATARDTASRLRDEAGAARDALARVLAQAARELDPSQPTVYNEHHWGIKNNATLSLSPEQRAALDKLGDEYFGRTGRGLTVTSGTRSAAEQADAMYKKLAHPDHGYENNPLHDYKGSSLAKDIQKAYLEHPGDPAGARQAMTQAIIDQTTGHPPKYISKHLIAGAIDVRDNDMTTEQKKAFVAAVQATGLFDASSPHSEDGGSGSGPHQHLQLR
jgi:uncharacterized protein YukE